MPLKPYLQKLFNRQPLTEVEATAACELMADDKATPSQVAAFLGAMAPMATADISTAFCGFALALQRRSTLLQAPPGTIGICGADPDSKDIYNVSIATALVTAACGVPVANHGNAGYRTLSTTAQILAALDLNIDAPVTAVQHSLNEAGFCFILSPRHHKGMNTVSQVRREIGIPMAFDLLCPLVNPAEVKRHLIGAYKIDEMEPMAAALRRLRADVAWIVHGSDGIGQLSTTGPARIVELRGGKINTFEISPEDAGLPKAALKDLRCDDAKTNAAALRGLINGRTGPYRDIVLLNVAAALVVADKASDLKTGVGMATRAIDDGRAAGVFALASTIYKREAA